MDWFVQHFMELFYERPSVSLCPHEWVRLEVLGVNTASRFARYQFDAISFC